MCTKTSWLPSSGWMNPKPFWPLNHFTVPCVMSLYFGICAVRPHASAASLFEIWRKVVSPTRLCREAKSFGRSSIDAVWSIGAADARLTSEWQGSFRGLVDWPLRHCEAPLLPLWRPSAVKITITEDPARGQKGWEQHHCSLRDIALSFRYLRREGQIRESHQSIAGNRSAIKNPRG
jgi:hypothetical protein